MIVNQEMGTPAPPITLFTPSFADEGNTNAQNLTVKEIVARLPSEQFRVVMLCSKSPDPRIAARENTLLLNYRKHGNVARLLARLITSVPDVYFFPREGPLDGAFLFLRRRFRLKTALVTYIVSGGLRRDNWPAARYRNIREADVLVGNNSYLTNLLRRQLHVEAATVHDGIDRRFYFARPRSPNQKLTVLYAGSLRPYKRVDLVVREAARRPNVMFRIAGAGEEGDRCRMLARNLGCQNVAFLGHLAPLELGEQMRRADVFFFPSVLEGHPQVLGQAAACGLPVIAMNCYRPDYVVAGQTGLLAESDQDLTQCLDRALQDNVLRCSMREAAVQHAGKFDWDGITQQWMRIFQQATAPERRGSRFPMVESTNSCEADSRHVVASL